METQEKVGILIVAGVIAAGGIFLACIFWPSNRKVPAAPVPAPLVAAPAVAQSSPSTPAKQPKDRRSDAAPDANPGASRRPAARDESVAVKPEDAEAALREAEQKLAEMVAKLAPAGDGPDLIESTIEGEFSGWEGETIFNLSNGQVWQQVTYAYTYHYAYRPKVLIFKTQGVYKMKVDGVDGTIFVKRLAADNGEIDLYGADGVAVAYIVVGGRESPIYLWSGEPVAYLSGESIYGFNGKHIGWYRNSSVYDHEGKLVATPKDKALVKAKPLEAKGAKKMQPLKGLKELKPLKPLWGIGTSDLPAKAFFSQGGDGPDLIESRIEGEFEGWDGDTIFKLSNGQIWQQATYAYTYHYAFRPKVLIIKTNGAYKMKVDGVSSTIFVKRLK